jgi:cyclase
MQSLKFIFFLGIASLTFASHSYAQPETAKVRIEPLRGPLHLLQGRGGNVVASVGADGILLVDDDYAALTPAYAAALEGLAGAPTAVRFVLNTHWHQDHTGGNAYWGERQALIFAHSNVRDRMSKRQGPNALGRVTEPSPPAALPLVTFGDSISLHFNGTDIELQHYPRGHTDGDSVVYFAQHNVVHMGDFFFADRFPFVDLSSGGSIAGYLAGLEAVLARVDDNTLIIPGHGDLAGRVDLQRFRKMILTTSSTVHESLAAGQSPDDIVAQGLGSQWVSWGKEFISEESWIRILAADHEHSR